jgi:elongation factor P--(R)-beta-lysine ligase
VAPKSSATRFFTGLTMADVHKPDDFRPTANWTNLRLRADLLRRLRDFFHTRGFLEVETPLLSADTVIDRHLDPFPVRGDGDPTGADTTYWLQTSPEFAMKRLLAAGAEAIYQVTRAFRQSELGPLHNPEFTIVEWYRPGHDMTRGMRLLSDLCDELLELGPAERISYREAFERYVGINPHTSETGDIRAAAESSGVSIPASIPDDDRDGWLDLLLSERVGPRLGIDRPTIIFDYPASQAALARVRHQNPPLAERFELFVSGVELANGYHELLDPAILRKRNAENNAQRSRDGKPRLPGESRLLAAMESGLPASTGVALGFDRLVMLAAGVKRLDEVIAFPFDRA